MLANSEGGATPSHVRRSRFVIGALGLLAAAVVATGNWLLSDLGAIEQKSAHGAVVRPPSSAIALPPAPNASELPLEPRVPPLTGTENILIAGQDRRPGEKLGGLTDTMIVVVLNKQSGHVGLISIPRDMAVEIPNHGLDRINTAFGLAYARGDNGLSAMKQAVSDLLALPIEHAVVVDLSIFERLVDALGGITVDVPCPIVDDFVDSRTANGRRVLDVQAGQVRMDGPTTAMYVRSRHGRSDFSRARRQQAVLAAIHRQLLGLGSLGQLPEVWETVERSIVTDLKRYQLLDLGRRALGLDMGHIHGLVLAEGYAEARMDRGRAMLFPNLDAIDAAVGRLFSSSTPGVLGREPVCPRADVALRRKQPLATSPSTELEPDAGTVESESEHPASGAQQ